MPSNCSGLPRDDLQAGDIQMLVMLRGRSPIVLSCNKVFLQADASQVIPLESSGSRSLCCGSRDCIVADNTTEAEKSGKIPEAEEYSGTPGRTLEWTRSRSRCSAASY